jgi:protein-S-isoprenylcysteine O-methyltransferase Ste14
MTATLLGLFLTAPNALTLLITGLGITLIQIQVRLEEERLSHLYGAAYEAYRLRVRRWL